MWDIKDGVVHNTSDLISEPGGKHQLKVRTVVSKNCI